MTNSTEKKNRCGEKLSSLREKAQMTREVLSAKLTQYGCTLSEADIAAIESGTRCVYDTELPAIGKALETSIADLF